MTSSPFSFTKSLKKALLIWLLVFNVFGVALYPQAAHAGVWGESFAAELFGKLWDTIKRALEGAILGTLKVAAIEIINSKVGQMIGGTSVGNALFVTDWEDFLYNQPAERVRLYMNDFFTITTRGKYASANYIGSRDVPDTVAGNYPAYLVGQAQAEIAAEATTSIEYDLDEYASVHEVFNGESDNGWRAWNAFFSNPANNPFGYGLAAVAEQGKIMNREIEKAKTEVQSSGLLGKKEGGKTIAPAATVDAILSDAQNIGNNLIAAAENPGEFLSGVVGAVVQRAVTNIIQKGVGKVQENIRREIREADARVVKALDKANKELGPAAKYTSELSQKTDVYVKPYTTPPPNAKDTGVYCDGGC